MSVTSRVNDLHQIIWKGRQWAVTEYGLETIGEPYHYYLGVEQLGHFGQGDRANKFDSLIHMMEKNWLDVDDFVTAYLVALSVHGICAETQVVRESLREAMDERESLYTPRPGQLPGHPPGGVYSMADLDKYQPYPPWHGSQVLGEAVGGAISQPRTPDEAE